jgi:hypothetical protein
MSMTGPILTGLRGTKITGSISYTISAGVVQAVLLLACVPTIGIAAAGLSMAHLSLRRLASFISLCHVEPHDSRHPRAPV